MQFQLRTAVEFFGVAAYLLFVFAIIGAPVKLLLNALGITVHRVVSSMMIGISIAIVVSWYSAAPLDGTKGGVRILFVLALLVVAARGIMLVARRGAIGAMLRDTRLRETALLFVIVVGGLSAITLVNDTQFFTRDGLTTFSLGNNDAPSYALVGQHMLDDGPRDPGNIVGTDLGARTTEFSNGGVAIIAASSSLTGLDTYKVMQPLMFVTLVVSAFAIALLLRAIWPRGPMLAVGAAAVTGFGVPYVAYTSGQWFYSQMYAIGLAVSIIAIARAAVGTEVRKEQLAAVGVVGILAGAGLSAYPHMLLASTLVLLPIAAVTNASWRPLLRRCIVAGLVYGLGLVVAAVLVPGLVGDAVDEIRRLADIEAGWSLPSIFPTEMLGFQSEIGGSQSAATVIVSVLVLVGLAVAAVAAWRRGLGAIVAPLVAAIVLVLATYAVVYWREDGPTYQQWKWITFFTPLVVAAAITLVLMTLFECVKPSERGHRVGWTVFGAYVVISVLAFAPTAGFPLRAAPNSFSSATADLADVEVNPRLDGIDAIHINTTTWWETMWLDYFLRDKTTTASLGTYYAPSEPAGEWWIERNDQPPIPGAELIQLNDTYRIARPPAAVAAAPEGSDGSEGQATGRAPGAPVTESWR